MTTTTTTSPSVGREGMRLYTRHVIGEAEAVRTVLEHAHAEGRLVGLRAPAWLPDGRVSITADLLEPQPPTRTRRLSWPRLRPWLIGAGVLAGAAALAGLVWVIVLAVLALIALITAVVGWVAAHWVVIAVGLGLLLLLVGGGGRCAGIHCGGCRG